MNNHHRHIEILDEIDLCVQASGLEKERVRELSGFAKEHDLSLIEILVDRGGVEESALLQGLAKLLELPLDEVEPDTIPDEILAKISPDIAIGHRIMPIKAIDGRLGIAVWDPFDWQHWEELTYLLDASLEKILYPRSVIDQMLKTYYGIGADTIARLVANRPSQEQTISSRITTDLEEKEAANEPTVVNLVNKILSEAIQTNATDIHFESYEDKYRIRYRIDGMLEDISVPVSVKLLKLALVSRLKIMSKMDITEKRLPQDGRCQVSLGGQSYDLRVSILPGIYGEAVVIRLQSRQMMKLDLGILGFRDEEKEKISQLCSRPYGLMMVTGPTGSGKTTTLYACLNRINQPQVKIVTIEDPVEYWMEDILQMQVHEEIGFTFARALRSILRHDPDVILVGEVRDRETADIAIRSSLTGHLVFATLHTNDATSAVTRLIDIGIEPFLAASSVQGILAQRLVRKICPNCKQKQDNSSLMDIERCLFEEAGCQDNLSFWQGQGCEKCRFTGYRGRTAIGEVVLVLPEIRSVIQQRVPADRIKEIASREGARTLRENALWAAKEGITTIAEVLRVTQEDF